MDFIGRRFVSGSVAVWFAVWSILMPVTASAVTYNAASSFTGRAWYVAGAGTPLAGVSVVATAASLLNKVNPWVAAISLGMPIAQLILEAKGGVNVNVLAKNGLMYPPPPGWVDSETPPTTVAQQGTGTVPATAGPTQARWHGSRMNGTTGVVDLNYYEGGSAAAVGSPMCSYTASTLSPAQTGSFTSFNASYNRADCTFSVWGFPNTGGGMSQYCPSPSSQVSGASPNLVCSGTTYSCPNGGSLSGNTCTGAPVCPAGYSPSGGACSLSNAAAAQWPSDNQPTLRMGENSVGPHPRDPDPMPSAIDPAEAMSGPANLQFPDPLGHPFQHALTPTATGGYTFTQTLQTVNNNQTYTTTNNISVSNLGRVTDATVKTTPGTLAQSGTAAQQSPFPDDYNKEVTQQKILTGEGAQDAPDFATSVESKRAAAQKELTDKLDALPGQYASDKGNWFSWVWTPPVGTCAPFTGTVHGKDVSWDLCPYVLKVRDVIGWLFALFGGWVVYGELFRRES